MLWKCMGNILKEDLDSHYYITTVKWKCSEIYLHRQLSCATELLQKSQFMPMRD